MGSAERRRIGQALARLWTSRGDSGRQALEQVVSTPGCEWGLVVEERLKEMHADIVSMKALLRALLLAVFGALAGLVVDILLRGIP